MKASTPPTNKKPVRKVIKWISRNEEKTQKSFFVRTWFTLDDTPHILKDAAVAFFCKGSGNFNVNAAVELDHADSAQRSPVFLKNFIFKPLFDFLRVRKRNQHNKNELDEYNIDILTVRILKFLIAERIVCSFVLYDIRLINLLVYRQF